MKFMLIFLMAFAPYGHTQSIHDKKIKEQMLSRTEELLLKIEESQNALEREDVAITCKKINQIFKILPDHLISIGTRMNLFNPQVIKMENQTKSFLIFIHQQSNICQKGGPGEYLDMTEVLKRLKLAYKMLEKQKNEIKRLDTDFENIYNYYYEFY